MKYRGKARMTSEMLAALLGLPEDVDIIGIEYDASREIFNVLMSSVEEVEGYTFETGEGMEIRTIDGDEFQLGILENAIALINDVAGYEAVEVVEEDEDA